MNLRNTGIRLGVKIVKSFFPILRPFLRLARNAYTSYRNQLPDYYYNAWAKSNKNSCYVEKIIIHKPLISILVPIYNTPYSYLLEMIYSVVNQHYDNWELILVNASSDRLSRSQVENCADVDDRIKVVTIEKNLGISKNTNVAIQNASGEFIAFFDHDDLLHPCALHSIVEALQSSKKPDLLYTDEDKIDSTSTRYFSPHCKPDWSPDLMCNVNYINHLTVVRREMVDGIGGLRSECDGAQDYDLLLRIIDEYRPNIKHIPRILYSWRAAAQSTAQDISTKKYIFKAGEKALSEHIQRNKIPAVAKAISGKPGFYELIYKPVDFSIIIGEVAATKEAACAKWINELLAEPTGSEVLRELIVGRWYKKFVKDTPRNTRIKYVSNRGRGYWSEAAGLVTKQVAVCFKMAAKPNTNNGLSKLAAVAADPRHTAVSPVIVSGNNTILDSGIVHSPQLPKKLFEGYRYGRYTYFGNTDWVRNVDDLTTNVVALRTDKLIELIKFGIRSYRRSDTIMSLIQGSAIWGSRYVVWAHTPFQYKGLLKPITQNSYHNSQLFKFTPVVTMHVDNWGEGSAREPEN